MNSIQILNLEKLKVKTLTKIMIPTDEDVLRFINDKEINRIDLVSPILKQTIIEILLYKKKWEEKN